MYDYLIIFSTDRHLPCDSTMRVGSKIDSIEMVNIIREKILEEMRKKDNRVNQINLLNIVYLGEHNE